MGTCEYIKERYLILTWIGNNHFGIDGPPMTIKDSVTIMTVSLSRDVTDCCVVTVNKRATILVRIHQKSGHGYWLNVSPVIDTWWTSHSVTYL